MPVGGLSREGVMEIGEDEAAAAWQAKEEKITEPGGQGAQEEFRGVRKEPTEKF